MQIIYTIKANFYLNHVCSVFTFVNDVDDDDA